MKNLAVTGCFIFISFLTACGGGSSSPVIEDEQNSIPIADAGTDQIAFLNEPFQLDASLSSDPDNDALTYTWEASLIPVGSESQLSSGSDMKPTFTPDKIGNYEFSLVVSDGFLSSQEDRVLITVNEQNTAPIAMAGRDQHASVQTVVWLDGSESFDNEMQTLSYQWQFIQVPSESNVVLENSESVTPHFSALVAGEYIIELIVNDGYADSPADTVLIRVSAGNSVPIAHAGSDQNVLFNSLVELDASLSSDADNDALTYAWNFVEKPSSSAAILTSPSAVKSTFTADKLGTYRLSLVVSDSQSSSEADLVDIIVSEQNNPPTANAGVDQQVYLNQEVILSASESSDVDGDPLTYSWSFVSIPENSQSNLNNEASVSASFTVDQPGQYTVKLTVTDEHGATDSDNVVVTVVEEDTSLVGLVTGKLIDTQNRALANIQLKVDGVALVSNQTGVFSTVVEAAENETISIEIDDPQIPSARFTSEQIVRNDGLVGYDFAVNLNSQKLPVLQTISVSLFSCEIAGGKYSGPSQAEVIFILDAHESTLFNIEHRQTVSIPVGGNATFQLPALAQHDVSINGFNVAGNDLIFGETANFTHYTEGGLASFHVCDSD